MFLFPGMEILGIDNKLYLKIAEDIEKGNLIGGQFSLFTSTTPLYSYFIALCFKIFGKDLLIIRFLQIVIGSFTPIFIYLLTANIFNKRAAIFSSLLSVFFAPFTYYESLIWKFSLLPFLSILFLYTLWNASQYSTFINNFLFGIIATIIYFFRPNILNVLIFMTPIYLFYPLKKISLSSIIGLTIGFLLIATPVYIRYYNAKKRGLISNLGGIHFFLGNNSKATGTFHNFKGFKPNYYNNFYRAKKIAEKETGKKLNSKEISFFWYKKGLIWIKNNPLNFFKLFLKKLIMAFSFREIGEENIYNFWKYRSFLKSFLQPSMIIFTGLLGLIIAKIKDFNINFIIIFLITYLISLCIFLVTGRYRLPMIIALFPSSGYLISFVIDNVFKQKNFINFKLKKNNILNKVEDL